MPRAYAAASWCIVHLYVLVFCLLIFYLVLCGRLGWLLASSRYYSLSHRIVCWDNKWLANVGAIMWRTRYLSAWNMRSDWFFLNLITFWQIIFCSLQIKTSRKAVLWQGNRMYDAVLKFDKIYSGIAWFSLRLFSAIERLSCSYACMYANAYVHHYRPLVMQVVFKHWSHYCSFIHYWNKNALLSLKTNKRERVITGVGEPRGTLVDELAASDVHLERSTTAWLQVVDSIQRLSQLWSCHVAAITAGRGIFGDVPVLLLQLTMTRLVGEVFCRRRTADLFLVSL